MVKKEASDCSQSNDSVITSSAASGSNSNSSSGSNSNSSTSLSSSSPIASSNPLTSLHHQTNFNPNHQQQFHLLSNTLQQQYQAQTNKLIASSGKSSFPKLNPNTGSDMQNLANQLAVAAQNEMYFQHAAADLSSAYSKLQPVAAVAAAHLISAAAAQQQQQQQQQNNSIGESTAGSSSASSCKEILLSRELAGHFNAAAAHKERSHVDSSAPIGSGSGRSNGGHHSSASSASSNSGGGPGGDVVVVVEETVRKREMRLLKNREAARECRRKKKEYIKCLENRVAVLETQNKTLIDELKSLKELYCQSGDGVPNH